MRSTTAELFKHRNALVSLVLTDLKQRYSDIVAGLFWSVVHPLILLFVYTFVFSVILKVSIRGTNSALDYGVFLFAGMLPWMVIQESVARATSVFFEQRETLRHVRLPVHIVPIFPVLASFIHHLLALAVFLVLIPFFGYSFNLSLVLLIPAFIALFLITSALALLVSGFNVYWLDTGPLSQAILWILFFATPIVYPLGIVPTRLQWLLEINPLTQLVELYRWAFFGFPSLSSWKIAYLFGWAIFGFAFAFWIFSKLERDIADYL